MDAFSRLLDSAVELLERITSEQGTGKFDEEPVIELGAKLTYVLQELSDFYSEDSDADGVDLDGLIAETATDVENQSACCEPKPIVELIYKLHRQLFQHGNAPIYMYQIRIAPPVSPPPPPPPPPRGRMTGIRCRGESICSESTYDLS